MRRTSGALLGMVVALGSWACGGVEQNGEDSGHCNVKREAQRGVEGLPCNAGFWVSCTCDSGRRGSRLCSTDGSAYAGTCTIIETIASGEVE